MSSDGNQLLRQWARESLPTVPVPSIDSKDRASMKVILSDMEAQIQSFQARISTLQIESSRARAILSPIRALPTEIIARILAEHLNNVPDVPVFYPRSSVQCTTDRLAPLEVCRLWRNAAVSSPSCWIRLDITVNVEVGILKRLRLQFQRSHTLPVDLTLRAGRPYTFEFIDWRQRKEELEYALARNSPKIRSYIEIGDSFGSRMMSSFVYIRDNKITHLRLAWMRWHGNERLMQSCVLPALESLHISTGSFHDLHRLHCPSLRTLILEAAPPYASTTSDPRTFPMEFITMLKKYQKLKVLIVPVFNIMFWRWPTELRQNSVEHITIHASQTPSTAYGLGTRPFRTFLYCFPNIKSLTLHSIIMDLHDRNQSRQLPQITNINELFFEGYITSPSVTAALEAIPNLKFIRFDGRNTTFNPEASSHHDYSHYSYYAPDINTPTCRVDPAMILTLSQLLRKDTRRSPNDNQPPNVGSCLMLESLEFHGFHLTTHQFARLFSPLKAREDLFRGINGNESTNSTTTTTTSQGCVCLLTLRKCFFQRGKVIVPIPDSENLSYSDAALLYDTLHADSLKIEETNQQSEVPMPPEPLNVKDGMRYLFARRMHYC